MKNSYEFVLSTVLSTECTLSVPDQNSMLLAQMQWYICFLPCWSGANIKRTLHVARQKRPINQFKLDQQSRQQGLRAYCPNIYLLWLLYHAFTWRAQQHTAQNIRDIRSLKLFRQVTSSLNFVDQSDQILQLMKH